MEEFLERQIAIVLGIIGKVDIFELTSHFLVCLRYPVEGENKTMDFKWLGPLCLLKEARRYVDDKEIGDDGYVLKLYAICYSREEIKVEIEIPEEKWFAF